jgi:DNA-binding CsgD family transcriptional regulator
VRHAEATARYPEDAGEGGWEGRNRELVRRLIEESGHGAAVREAGDGHEVVLLDLVVDGVRCVLSRKPEAEEPRAEVALSPREREIVRMVAKGYPNKVIARVLEISSWTVSTHLRRIFAKLGVSTRAAMIARLSDGGPLHDPAFLSSGYHKPDR